MTTFTIITGIATLLAFALQLRDVLPEYRRYYALITWSLLGLTAGLAIASFTNVTVLLPSTLSTRNIVGLLLFGGTGILVFLCFAASTLIADDKRRREVCQVGSAVSGFLIFLLLFFSSFCFPEVSSPPSDALTMTYDERVDCAVTHARKGNYGRALEWLSEARKPVRYGDPRYESLEKLIQQIKAKQQEDHAAAIDLAPSKDAKVPNNAVNPSGGSGGF
jgi:hypothetical protein